MIRQFKYILIMFLYLYMLLGCTTTSPLKEALGDCSSDIKNLNAYGDTLQLKYDIDSKSKADEAARSWCEDRDKYATKNTNSCENGCCVTTYRCKKN